MYMLHTCVCVRAIAMYYYGQRHLVGNLWALDAFRTHSVYLLGREYVVFSLLCMLAYRL